MIIRTISLTFVVAILAAPSFAGQSGQHSTQSIRHSGQAASHSSAAISTGVVTVIAVPIMAFGLSIAISGAALEDVSNEVLQSSNNSTHTGQPKTTRRVLPNGAPTLD